MRRCVALSLFICFLAPGRPCTAQQLQIIAPVDFIQGLTLPIVVEARTNGTIDLFHSQDLSFNLTGGQSENGTLKVKKGRGMASIAAGTGNSIEMGGSGISLNLSANQSQPSVHGGSLNGSEDWSSGTVHRITSDLSIGTGDTLMIESGCWVLLGPAVNITVNGYLKVSGTDTGPVVFIPSESSSGWGGIIAQAGNISLNYTLMTGGGADATQAYGHSGSQATVKSNGGDAVLHRCFIFDCYGKGIGAQNGVMQFTGGGISRCDMGGEFGGSYVRVLSSHILDMPNDDGLFDDDDNDGFYFSGTYTGISLPSVVDSCVFIIGKDDAIDHNAAVLEVRNSWIEGFENEGVAASNANSVLVFNTLVKDCEQGIEAGYGTPAVTVDHCVLIGNDNGLRFGDWYDWGSNGSIVCTNSIMYGNGDNIYNFDVLSNGPIADAMDVTYSLTNDLEYDSGLGNLTGTPLFTPDYLLENRSPGKDAGNDGSDMGLVAPVGTGISELPDSRKDGRLISFRIHDMQGRQVMAGSSGTGPAVAIRTLANGIYIMEEHYVNRTRTYKTLIWR